VRKRHPVNGIYMISIDGLVQQWQEITFLEFVGVAFGIIQVHLAKRNNPWLYFFGIISVSITLMLLWSVGLYAEWMLNVYYLIMSIYGWYWWLRKGEHAQVQAGYATQTQWITAVMAILIGWPLIWWVLYTFTTSDVALWDAWVSITACVGMWLLAKRKIENWIFLNISNAFAVPLLWQKGLMLFSLLTVYLFIIAILGYIEWRKLIQKQKSSTNLHV
jgi:nicotinamide mononucleotide transporter